MRGRQGLSASATPHAVAKVLARVPGSLQGENHVAGFHRRKGNIETRQPALVWGIKIGRERGLGDSMR